MIASSRHPRGKRCLEFARTTAAATSNSHRACCEPFRLQGLLRGQDGYDLVSGCWQIGDLQASSSSRRDLNLSEPSSAALRRCTSALSPSRSRRPMHPSRVRWAGARLCALAHMYPYFQLRSSNRGRGKGDIRRTRGAETTATVFQTWQPGMWHGVGLES